MDMTLTWNLLFSAMLLQNRIKRRSLSSFSLSASMFCVFFNDRLLQPETGETKGDGSGLDPKMDCKSKENHACTYSTLNCFMRLRAGAAVEGGACMSPNVF